VVFHFLQDLEHGVLIDGVKGCYKDNKENVGSLAMMYSSDEDVSKAVEGFLTANMSNLCASSNTV
jgi:hypothetical protein